MPSPVMKINQTKSGSYTLTLHRPNRKPERWRAGIKTYEEALKRAQVAAGLCGYKVDKAVKLP